MAFTETVQLITLFQQSCDTETIPADNWLLVCAYAMFIQICWFFFFCPKEVLAFDFIYLNVIFK